MIPRPKMILKRDRKWSRTGNDPLCGPQMILPQSVEWHGVSFLGFLFFIFYFFIYFHQLNVDLDKRKEKIFSQRKL